MQYIEAPSNEEAVYRVRIFLAGGITSCPDWQSKVVEGLKDMDITIYNPRRKEFIVEDPRNAHEQILWEFQRLREATTVLFWFCKETINPITLFEYGAALERGEKQNIIAGADKEYSRLFDLQYQTQLISKRSPDIWNDLDDMVKSIRKTPFHGLLNPKRNNVYPINRF